MPLLVIALCTNAVVAICCVFVPTAAVGASGTPVSVGAVIEILPAPDWEITLVPLPVNVRLPWYTRPVFPKLAVEGRDEWMSHVPAVVVFVRRIA